MFFLHILLVSSCMGASAEFPLALVEFVPGDTNPVFQASGPGHWDEHIRERGWIMHEDGMYHMWYTGYEGSDSSVKKLGYATSPDGLVWTRYPGNPIYDKDWVEDVTIVKLDGTYYMFAEGENDRAKLLTSNDRIHWALQGVIDIRKANGDPLPPGPLGTPAVLHENGTWYLFYEREDEAVWLATSKDLKTFTNVQDEPVIRRGPGEYDQIMLALNQVIKHKGRYYAYYHAVGPEKGKNHWMMNVAVSDDLVHWTKYPGNPIVRENMSSGFLVNDGQGFRMYTMHPDVCVHYPKGRQ